MRCVAAVEGEEGPLRYYPLVGELYPAHAGATSKSYYAFLPDEQRHRLFRGRPMARFTERTHADRDRMSWSGSSSPSGRRGTRGRSASTTPGSAPSPSPSSLGREPYGSLSLGAARGALPDGPDSRLDALRRAARLLERRLTHPPQRTRRARATD